MIKLYKNAEKNEKIKAVIADLRKTSRPFSFKYYCMTERISWIMSHYELESWEMARKITWILTGDCQDRCKSAKLLERTMQCTFLQVTRHQTQKKEKNHEKYKSNYTR